MPLELPDSCAIPLDAPFDPELPATYRHVTFQWMFFLPEFFPPVPMRSIRIRAEGQLPLRIQRRGILQA